MKVSPSPSLFIAGVAVKSQMNYYLYFNCTYESDETSPICYEKILIALLKSSSAVFREVGLGVGIAAALVGYSTLITVHAVVEALKERVCLLLI